MSIQAVGSFVGRATSWYIINALMMIICTAAVACVVSFGRNFLVFLSEQSPLILGRNQTARCRNGGTRLTFNMSSYAAQIVAFYWDLYVGSCGPLWRRSLARAC